MIKSNDPFITETYNLSRLSEITLPITSFSYDGSLQYNADVDVCCSICNQVFTTRFGRLLRKQFCTICNSSLPKSCEEAEVTLTKIDEGKCIILHIDGLRKKDRLILQCTLCEKVFETSVQSVFYNKSTCSCGKANNPNRLDRKPYIERIKKEINERYSGLVEFIDDVNNEHEKCRIMCKVCGDIRYIKLHSLWVNDSIRCSNCLRIINTHIRTHKKTTRRIEFKNSAYASQLEKTIADLLVENHIEFKYQYVIEGQPYLKNKPFDFYLPAYNYIIEVHGTQHYEIRHKMIRNEQELIRRKTIDGRKKEFAWQLGYNYLEIPYNKVNRSMEILDFISKPQTPYTLAIFNAEINESEYIRYPNFKL